MKSPLCLKLVSLSVGFVAVAFLSSVQSQYFEANVNDQVYLNLTHNKVRQNVVQTRHDLSKQAEVVRAATRAYIGAKLKENLFRELRTLAEKELEALSMQNRPRQPRQDEDGDEEEIGILPQLATIVKAIFGNNVNVTKYVESASKLLPRPIGAQLIGVATLLDTNRFTTTTAPKIVPVPVTPSPVNVTVIHLLGNQYAPGSGQQGQFVPFPVNPSPAGNSSNGGIVVTSVTQTPPVATTSTKLPGDDDDDDGVRGDIEEDGVQEDIDDDVEAEGRRVRRQVPVLQGINPMKVLDGVEAIWKSFQQSTTELSPDSPAYLKQSASTTETEAGFDDEYTTPRSRVQIAVKGVVSQVGALRKGVPDLFQGAREAYKFLETLNVFLDKWDNQLQAASKDDDDK